MKLRETTIALLKIVAIFIFTNITITRVWFSLYYLFATEDTPNRNEILVYDLSQSIVFLLIPILLWIFAGRISKTIVGNDVEFDIKKGNDSIIELSLTIIGLYLIASNIAPFIANSYPIFFQKPQANNVYNNSIKNLIQSAISIIIGLICINSSSNIFNIIRKLKAAGVE